MPDGARSDHPAVQAQLDRLSLLSPGGDSLGLDRITRLLDRLGRPQDSLPPVFHVAGTNGKGSTCAFVRAAIEAAGLRAHVFTSPHLVRFNERIRVAGRLIEDEVLAAMLAEVLAVGGDIQPSFFEVTTAVAFLAFARTPADACIVEVGLGGRLDATNVVEAPAVCGIASLGIDHQAWLGDRLIDIASEKAGIAKCGVSLVTHDYGPDVAERISEVAARVGARHVARGDGWDLALVGEQLSYWDRQSELALPGPRLSGGHQALNAGLAIAMLRHQERVVVSPRALATAMTDAEWPARLEKLRNGPLAENCEIWVDGAHNAEAARALAAALHGEAKHIVLGILANKDADAIVTALAPHALSMTFVPVPDHAFHDPADLAERFGGHAAASLDEALAPLPSPILIAGSLYLAGEVLRLNAQAPE